MYRYKIKIIVFLFMGFVTAFSSLFFDRYQECGPEMLENPDFEQGLAYWKVQKRPGCLVALQDGVLQIVSTEPNRSVQIWQPVQAFEKVIVVRVKALIRCKDVVPGNKSWNRPRLILKQQDGTATQWKLPHTVAVLFGTTNWKSYSNTFVIAPGTRELRVTAQLAHCTGSMWLKELSLMPVRQASWYGWAQKTIFSAWGIYLVFIFGSCIGSGKKNSLMILLVITSALILIGTSMPGQMKKQLTKDFENQMHRYSSEVNDTVQEIEQTFHKFIPCDVSKIAHLVMFIGFGLILSSIMVAAPGAPILFNLMLFAGATEFIQFYVDGRTPLLGDFLIDSAGGLLGLFMVKIMTVYRNHDN